MKTILYMLLFTSTLFPLSACASPYTGQENREIKSLTPQDISDYLSGKGMGLAKAAELNHYPGPRHVLDLASELKLSSEQTSKTQSLYDHMQAQAISLGKEFIEREMELNKRFADATIDPQSLEALLAEISALQARIRYVHLVSHLEQKSILTAEQVFLYDKHRGYDHEHHHHAQ